MLNRKKLSLALTMLVAFMAGRSSAADIQYVIHVSIDGGGSSYVQNLVDLNQMPNFKRMQDEGAGTNNARCDYDYSVTLPNHTTQVTGRGVLGVGGNGHGWTSNSDPLPGETIHFNKGSYVASVFDVVHDNGLSTGAYVGKSKFSLLDTSYNATNGAVDITGPDNGRDKIDTYLYLSSDSAGLMTSFISTMSGASPLDYSFIHFTEPDGAGHSSGWGSADYNNALIAIDGHLGDIFNLVENDADLVGKTAIIVTADHGGQGTGHSDASNPLMYTVPFYVWGPGIDAGADLYALNSASRLDPDGGRPDYSAALQPIRNGDAANLALDLLGLNAIPGSAINNLQNMVVPEPATMTLLVLGAAALIRRRR